MRNYVDSLLDFIEQSPSCYHVVQNFAEMLRAQGYHPLDEGRQWTLQPGGKYYTTRNGSSILAFRVPACGPKAVSYTHLTLPTTAGV